MPKTRTGFQLVLFILMVTSATAAELAVTLDDLPYVAPDRISAEEGLARIEAINAALGKHNVTAAGFAIGANVTDESAPALHAFAAAGHLIGNHSWSHPNYNAISVDEFRSETMQADNALADWLGPQKYYRFPHLSEGDTSRKREAAEMVLRDLGYRNAPVTIEIADWLFDRDYTRALKNDNARAASGVATRYLDHAQKTAEKMEALVQDELGRSVRHVLLLHANKINEDHLEQLLDRFAADGWKFISLQDALSDPLYSSPGIYVGPAGRTHIERVTERR